jgi:hypothetical protein
MRLSTVSYFGLQAGREPFTDRWQTVLVHKFTRFLTQRAESFFILRRKPIQVSTGPTNFNARLQDHVYIANDILGLRYLLPGD